ncbi:hypothetical protein CQ10_35030 [Bradyrhizobium valentinum]|nr:hypothetical protein CQ10_35030 [Bradyrhizobium valentinum]
MESELGLRSYTDFVVRDRAENNCTGRGAEAIDDDRLSGGPQFFISIYIATDLPASIISNPNHRMACACIRKQERCREHRRWTIHASSKESTHPADRYKEPHMLILPVATTRQQSNPTGGISDVD